MQPSFIIENYDRIFVTFDCIDLEKSSNHTRLFSERATNFPELANKRLMSTPSLHTTIAI